MRIAGKPVFPVVQTGGDAKKFLEHMCKKWYEESIPNVTAARYSRLGLPLSDVERELVEQLRLWST